MSSIIIWSSATDVKTDRLQWKLKVYRGKKDLAKTCLTGGGNVEKTVFNNIF